MRRTVGIRRLRGPHLRSYRRLRSQPFQARQGECQGRYRRSPNRRNVMGSRRRLDRIDDGSC